MTDDSLVRLRQQLVQAAHEQARPASTPERSRWRRPTLWVSLAASVAIPAGAAAAVGIIGSPDTGATSDGSTYTFAPVQDEKSSADPTTVDEAGRICTRMEIKDRNGKLSQYGIECRPADAALTDPVSAGFTLTPSQELIVGGSVEARTTKVVVVGQDRRVELGPAADGRKTYRVVLPQGRYEIVAYDELGQEVGRARTGT